MYLEYYRDLSGDTLLRKMPQDINESLLHIQDFLQKIEKYHSNFSSDSISRKTFRTVAEISPQIQSFAQILRYLRIAPQRVPENFAVTLQIRYFEVHLLYY